MLELSPRNWQHYWRRWLELGSAAVTLSKESRVSNARKKPRQWGGYSRVKTDDNILEMTLFFCVLLILLNYDAVACRFPSVSTYTKGVHGKSKESRVVRVMQEVAWRTWMFMMQVMFVS